jgi:hypothetical protein
MADREALGTRGAEFLGDIELRPLTLTNAPGLEPVGLALGPGGGALEIAVTRAGRKPAADDIRSAWKARHRGRAAPLLLVALYGDRAAICGPAGDEPPVFSDLDPGMVDRVCRSGLEQPDRHAALRFIWSVLPEIKEAPIPGLRNEGLLATHELVNGVPKRDDWTEAYRRAEPALAKRGRELLRALGYELIETHQEHWILKTAQQKIAVAVFLDRSEAENSASGRFGGMTPIQYALAKADEENLDYVLVDHGSSLRLYVTRSGLGVGRRGRTDTYVEAHLDLLPADRTGYLWLLFSGAALAPGGTLSEILERSHDFAAGLGARLRERVYTEVVPRLAVAIAQARGLRRVSAKDLAFNYEMTLLTLFRLLFIAYGEDKDLLPYRTNELYRDHALKTKARRLAKLRREGKREEFDESPTFWNEFKDLCHAVNAGKAMWGIPAYNGGLFSDHPKVSPAGAALNGIVVADRDFGRALSDLLVDDGPEGPGPVDFRSLSVREFGTIYEGLLESELSLAEENLVVDSNGFYAPAGKAEPVVRKGDFYLHNASGARKATGTYFTKSFAVDHLLEEALEPALDDHLKRLDDLDEIKAADAFFDFRVADIAMGSGHFLVAAVDRIERRLSSYLAKRKLKGVLEELDRLRNAALAQIQKAGGDPEGCTIEYVQLLRRQIARRCIYGVDINPIAVQLARLSLWIHTFVPGLPLSFLDHNIVCGNSLVGIGTTEEVADILGAGAAPVFGAQVREMLEPAWKHLRRLAELSDADAGQIEEARREFDNAKTATDLLAQMFDILTAARLPKFGPAPSIKELIESKEKDLLKIHVRANALLFETHSFHFPIAFPEVFLRARPGFDVILGNPPWEEATLEEDDFWTRFVPGMQGLPQAEVERIIKNWRRNRPDLLSQLETELRKAEGLRTALVHGPYPGMGEGDPDTYKAFCWRFWRIVASDGGRIGVVLPRSAMSAKGSSEFRITAFPLSDARLTFLLNSGGWVFDDAEPRYTIALAAIRRTGADGRISLKGPFPSKERYTAGKSDPYASFPAKDVLAWNDTAALPLLPSDKSVEVFAQMRKAPRLDLNNLKSWRARPHTELHATNDKKWMRLVEKQPAGTWPVFKGESFDIWTPDTGTYYAWADPEKLIPELDRRRKAGRNKSNSPFLEFKLNSAWFASENTLPCFGPRVAFRDVTNRTNRRTILAALLPPRVFITNKGPYFLWPRGDERDQAYLLGVLCSIPLDWYARRFVEVSVNYHILNAFPIPRPPLTDPLWKRTVELAGRLACPDKRFAPWAKAVGVECGPLDDDEMQDMICELDAVVAHLYGLSEAQLVHVFETFHEGWDYQDRLDAVLKHFRRMKA